MTKQEVRAYAAILSGLAGFCYSLLPPVSLQALSRLFVRISWFFPDSCGRCACALTKQSRISRP